MKFVLLTFLLTLFPLSAAAFEPEFDGPHIPSEGDCTQKENKDSWTLEKSEENPGEYLFKYTNSKWMCSTDIDGAIVEAPDGFTVRLFVRTGKHGRNEELIYVIAEDEAFMPFPAELYLPDDAKEGRIRLIPGMM